MDSMTTPGAVRSDIDSVLAQMRAMRQTAATELRRDMQVPDVAAPGATTDNQRVFANLLQDALGSVSELQSAASAQANAFVRGETKDLVSVMVAGQKSSIAFQALTQVRNRVVSAYQDIMNMPI